MINIYRSKNKQFYFTITTKKRVLVTSETYTRKSNCKNGIAALRKVMFKHYIETIDHTKK